MSYTVVYGVDSRGVTVAPLYGDNDPDIVRTAAGGFALATSHIGHVDAEVFDRMGVSLGSTGLGGTTGQIGRLSNGNLVTLDTHGDRAEYTIFDSTLHQVMPRTIIANQYNRPVVDSDVAGLVGGGFVAVSELFFNGNDDDIHIDVFGANGAVLRSFAPIRTGLIEENPSVTALDDGGFVVTWSQRDNTNYSVPPVIWYATYNADGTQRTAPVSYSSGPETNDPSVTALKGGGFAIVYEEREIAGGRSYIKALLVTDEGRTDIYLSTAYPADKHFDSDPSVSRLSNGLLAVSYSDNGDPPGTRLLIFDPVTQQTSFVAHIAGGLPSGDAFENSAVTAFGLAGDIAVFHTDATLGKVGGEILHAVRYWQGDNAPDVMIGDSLSDIMDGGGGADRMQGGAGSDTYTVDNPGDVVIENVADPTGIDAVSASISVDLLDTNHFIGQIENVRLLTGSGALNIRGNNLANFLVGNDSANVINGWTGADTMNGLGGDDTYYVDNPGDVVEETDATFNNDTVRGTISINLSDTVHFKGIIENIYLDGSSAIDATGNLFANQITGNNAANVIDGGGGVDTMKGGGGNDTYRVDNAGDVVVEGKDEGTADIVLSRVSYTLGKGVYVEFLQTNSTAGTGAINLVGNELSQTIVGNAGINTLTDGGGEGDILKGLGGNDIYRIASAATTIIEGKSEGTADIVLASVSFKLNAGAYVEFLQTNSSAGTGAIDLTGNELAQTLVGNAGSNRLDGKGGADTLTGRDGKDTFVFSTALNLGVDTITDFKAVDDTIELSKAVFSALSLGTLSTSAFRANTTGLAGDASDRIIYETDTGKLFYDADGNATGASGIHFATLTGHPTITNADFVVV